MILPRPENKSIEDWALELLIALQKYLPEFEQKIAALIEAVDALEDEPDPPTPEDQIFNDFANKAAAEAATVDASFDHIRIAGYHEPGDGGGAVYFRVVAEPSHDGKIQSTDGAWWELETGVMINVRQFGAVGDGVADDTEAFRSAAAYMRASVVNLIEDILFYGGAALGPMFLPPGFYLLTGSINLQLVRPPAGFGHVNAASWGIVGPGVVIGSMTGKIVFDCLGSNHGVFRDFSIFSDPDNPPAVGIGCGRIGDNSNGQPAGEFIFDNIAMSGPFTFANIFNKGGEENLYLNVKLFNDHDSGDSFCMVTDGFHHYDYPTDFTEPAWTPNTLSSCIGHTFINCQFQKMVSGSAMWFSTSSKIFLVGWNYLTTWDNWPAIVFYQGGLATFDTIQIQAHHEGTNPGTDYFMTVVAHAAGANIAFYGLELKLDGIAHDTAILRAGNNVSSLSLIGPTISHRLSTVPYSGPITEQYARRNWIDYNDYQYVATITDDDVEFFEVAHSTFNCPLLLVSGRVAANCGVVSLECDASPQATVGTFSAGLGANLAATTGVLTGTTGTDGKLTISAVNGGFYVENRTGVTVQFTAKGFSR